MIRTSGGRGQGIGWAVACLGLFISGCKGDDKPVAPSSPAPAPAALEKAPPAPPVVPEKQFTQKVWVIGFDGVDPAWLEAWVKAGKLPNVKKLMEEGTFKPLRSTNPPQSPVAWSSFATGTNPGGHGIYDFIRRDPKTYFPAVSTNDVSQAKFSPSGALLEPPAAVNLRTGMSFWKVASDQGVKTMALNVPYTFPPESMRHGETLSGLGTPDLRGTNSTFTFFSAALTPEDAAKGVAGGRLVSLPGAGPVWQASFDGPMGPADRATTAVTFTVDAGKKAVTIAMGKQSETVSERGWSDWFSYQYHVAPQYDVQGIGRFYVVSTSPLEVFMYPPNIDPDKPWIAFTSPTEYSAKLKERYGLFKTVGWTHDTNALNSEKLGDKPWLDDVFHAMDKLTEIGLGELDRDPPSLFIWVETATDRVAHMFTRATDTKSPRYDKKLVKELGGDPILLTYQRMDDVLGRIMSKLTPDTTLMVMSDHGFHTYRRGLHTNAWLVKNGYLVLQEEKTPGDDTNLFNAVDWSKTRAYALGTGQIYINLAGREGQGIVSQADYSPLVEEIAARIQALEDPKTREKPIAHVYKRDDIYHGVRLQDAPDLQVAFKEGWRTSWETMLGGIPQGEFADNSKKWSGDHAASDVGETAGIFLSNRKVQVEDPAIVDLAATVLSIFGVPKPATMEGRDLFGGTLTQPPVGGGPATP